jgi:hypothetical protein
MGLPPTRLVQLLLAHLLLQKLLVLQKLLIFLVIDVLFHLSFFVVPFALFEPISCSHKGKDTVYQDKEDILHHHEDGEIGEKFKEVGVIQSPISELEINHPS